MSIVYPRWDEWYLVPNTKIYTYKRGEAFIPEAFDLTIANFDDPSLPDFSDFKLSCNVPISTSVSGYIKLPDENMNPESYTGKGYPISDTLPEVDLVNNTSFPFVPDFINLDDLPNGQYVFQHLFSVTGFRSSDNERYFLGGKTFRTILIIENSIVGDDLINNPYTENVGFTLDTKKKIQFSSSNMDTYIDVDATIKTYDFFTDEENTYVIPQKLVLFKNKGQLEFGSAIHRFMNKIPFVNDAVQQYKYASLQISCTEKNNTDDSMIRTATSDLIYFVAGLSFGKTKGFLEFNSKPNRVTANGFAYLNMLLPEGEFHIKVLKNGNEIDTIELPENEGKIICKKVTFSSFQKGDVITYQLYDVTNDETIDTKTFCIFPNTFNSYMIVWENEFLLQSAIECTGEASVKLEIESTDQVIYEDLVEKIETLSVKDSPRLLINTGWLMKNDVDSVISLTRAKRAWLLVGNQTIDLRRGTKSMIAQDTTRALIEYSLEFPINKKYNEETYSL